MLAMGNGSVVAAFADFLVSDRMSCEESAIFFPNLAFMPHIIESNAIFFFEYQFLLLPIIALINSLFSKFWYKILVYW